MDLTSTLPAMSLAVVGAAYLNKDGSDRLEEIARCEPGELVELRPEPKNKKDRHAIAVLSARGVQIGYLSAERAPRIGALLRDGREIAAVFQGPAKFGAWIRVALDGAVPELPPRRLPAAGGDDDQEAGWLDWGA